MTVRTDRFFAVFQLFFVFAEVPDVVADAEIKNFFDRWPV